MRTAPGGHPPGPVLRLSATVLCACCALVWLLAAAPARADFDESFCAGNAAAPWVQGVNGLPPYPTYGDQCSTTGYYDLGVNFLSAMPSATTYAAGIELPSGEVLTGLSVAFQTDASSGGTAGLAIDYDDTAIVGGETGSAGLGTSISSAVPDATSLAFELVCLSSSSTPCTFPDVNPVRVGAMTLTIHDTGPPAVAAAGGSLATPGTYAGVQTVGYSASDAGSGVAKVTAALGSTVVATATATCQTAELSPCPHASSGVLTVDTTQVRNGTYPLTLTAYDVSGDPASVAVGSVRIRNSGTVSLRPRRRRGRVAARLVTGWNWGHPPLTRITSLRLEHLPRHGSVTLACRGPRCPRRHWASGRHVRRFERRLRGVAFHARDRLTFTIRAPHRVAERIAITIRRGHRPRGRVVR